MQTLILKLHEIQAIQFGNFTLKHGVQSPFYIDLRIAISYPALLKEMSELIAKRVKSLNYDLICGVPYAAIPLATALSIRDDIPMIMLRKKAKEYGTKKVIEGVFQPGQTCLVVEDVIAVGASILETAEQLRREGLKVTDAVVVVDREQGGNKKLQQEGIQLHSLIPISELITTLERAKKISESTAQAVKAFVATSH